METVLVNVEGSLWVGVGSDHTDRGVEGYSVAVSKQMCDKPLAPELWAFDDVAEHWDSLELRSWLVTGDRAPPLPRGSDERVARAQQAHRQIRRRIAQG